MKIHYIAVSGMRGCIPNDVWAFKDRHAAVDYLTELFELPHYGNKSKALHKLGYVPLEPWAYGAEYAEIQKCDCENFRNHNEGDD